MKDKLTMTSSAAGLLALLIVHFGWQTAAISQHPLATWVLFLGGFALAFLATVLAAMSLPRQWRSGRVLGRFIWCFAILAGFAGMLAYGP